MPKNAADEPLRIGTRGSRLALWQAERVAAALRARHPGLRTEIVPIQSHGDRHDSSITELGQVGIFTREIESELLAGRIDVAVHSLKDLPTQIPDGLALAALLRRDDPRDVLVAKSLAGHDPSDSRGALAALPHAARIATSSLRRRAELLRARSDLRVVELRGNVPTRLAKVEEGAVDGVVLSLAGLVRLDLDPPGCVPMHPDFMLPAPGQGTIAVQVGTKDARTHSLVSAIDDEPTRLCTTAERHLLHELEGGCRVPLGALAVLEADQMILRARLLGDDGRTVLEARAEGAADAASRLVSQITTSFRAGGATAILAAWRGEDSTR